VTLFLFIVVWLAALWVIGNFVGYLSVRDIGPLNWRILLGPKVYVEWAYDRKEVNY
jgi:hypothetical protein